MNKKILSTLITLFLISGCAGKTGHQFLAKMSNEEISSKLVKNKTSKAEVTEMFGDPEDIEMGVNEEETWLYKYTRSEAKGVNFVPVVSSFYGGTNDNIRKLKIKFNGCGLVDKFAFSSSKGETKTGLFQ